MQIRAITLFASQATLADDDRLADLGRQAEHLRQRMEQSGLAVQSLRLATPPAQAWVPDPAALAAAATALEVRAKAAGFRHVSLGTLRPGPDLAGWLAAVPQALAVTQWVFCSAQMQGADAAAYRACAETILANSRLGKDGFANLRFAAAFDMPPGGPFFPAAYQAEGAPDGFAIAIEGADVAVSAAQPGGTIDRFEQCLRELLTNSLQALARLGESERGELIFHGIDCALAPYPSAERSLGTAIEHLTGAPFGAPGTVTAVAALRRAVAGASFPKAGFNAPMLIVLEDAALAAGSGAGHYDWAHLLACTAAGSCGPDVVPLPGDTPPQRLAAALRDVAALARSVGRPLEMRVLPLPGRGVGAATQFSFDYFAPGRVMAL
ncbi:DUF711 family protein [Immundisolibacter sp.]